MEIKQCDFGILCEKPCDKTDYVRNKGRKKLSDFDEKRQSILLWRAGLLENKIENMTICFHHEQVFGNVFERKADKCCGVLKFHKRKAKPKLLIDLQMAKTLKSKGYHVLPGQKFCRQCVTEYQSIIKENDEKDKTDDDHNKEGSDSNNESMVYEDEDYHKDESPRKKLNSSLKSVGISPVNVHSVAKHSRQTNATAKLRKVFDKYKDSIETAYNVEDLRLEESKRSEVDDQVRQKAKELDRLHEAMKEKLKDATSSEKIQILTLIPDSWSRKYCAEYFGVSEYLIRTARELKKNNGILSKLAPKKGKKISQETIDLVQAFYQDDEFSRQLPGKKDCVSIRKKEYKQKRLVLCNLHELYVAFKEKYQDIKIGFSKFCSLRPKWCVIAGSTGTHSVCVCSIHQNAVLLVDAIDWDVSYKDLIQKVVCDPLNKECMMHRCSNCPGTAALLDFLDEELREFDLNDQFHYSQWETTDRASLITITTTFEEYKETLIEAIDLLTKHSFLAKCQASFLKSKKEALLANEAIVLGDFAENYQFLIQDEIQSYHWSKKYCTLHPLVLYLLDDNGELKHESFCFISNDNTHDTNFVYKLQTILVDFLKKNYGNITKLFYFSDGYAEQYKNYKNFVNLCHHEVDFGISAEWIFFATSHGKSPCDGIGGFVKRYVAKRSLQRPLQDQILDHETMFDLCQNEIKDIRFYCISQEEMMETREILKDRFELGKTVKGTRKSHHFIPLSCSKIGHKLTSEDEQFAEVFYFKITYVEKFNHNNLKCFTYVTCVYDTFWWVGMISSIDKEEGDAKIEFMHPHGPRKSFSWPSATDKCYVPFDDILAVINAPTTTSGRTYTISNNDYDQTIAVFNEYCS